MHAVLVEPIPLSPKRLLTSADWADYFDPNGSRRDEEITLSLIDFREIESVETIWRTDQGDESKHRFIFFARSSPEVIADAIKNTELDSSLPSMLVEDGWTPVDTVPPPAQQLADDSVDVDFVGNAAHSLRAGVSHYVVARTQPDAFVNAIPQLSRAVELLLKARLDELDATGLRGQPNVPKLIERLTGKGIVLLPTELKALTQLRRMRNDLQHGSTKLNYRAGLSVCRAVIVFLDRFVTCELDLWLGDAISDSDWFQLLAIPELRATATRIVADRIGQISLDPGVCIATCARCKREAMVSPTPDAGSHCLFCGFAPVRLSSYEI